MPNVRSQSQISRRGYHTSGDIKKTMKPVYARDDINQAFAGEENKGPVHATKSEKKDFGHSTSVKSRKSKLSKGKEPVR